MGVHRLGGQDTTVISILFTLVGAFLMSFIKVTDKRLKLEAVIGIIYAILIGDNYFSAQRHTLHSS